MPKSKKIILASVFILFIVLAGITYSTFLSLGYVGGVSKIAPWRVKINNQLISDSSTFTLNKINWTNSSNVVDGYAAPGGNGYYEIILDTSETKVAIDYTIGFGVSSIEENSNIRIEGITIDGNDVEFDGEFYDDYIPLQDVLNNRKIVFRINISWNDSEEYSIADTNVVLGYGSVELPITFTVRQHIDENDSPDKMVTQLIPYKEALLKAERPKDNLIITPYYDSTLDALYSNPERGLYNSNFLIMTKEGATVKDMRAKVSRLLYLKVDLSVFSAWRNSGTDENLTQAVLDTLSAQLENIKQNNNTVILRFVYDNNATAEVKGLNKFEPGQEKLKTHISQMGYIFRKYASTIYTIQVGFYGLWGESFYNTDVNSNYDYYTETMNALLDATAGTDIIIAFRTPKYAKYALDHSNHSDKSRVGVFNDAYLSQNDDMGTFENRTEQVEWLSSRNTSYGGEALPATFKDTSSEIESNNAYEYYYDNPSRFNSYLNELKSKKNNWDLISYTEDEMFKTHTSYINFEWNQYKHYIWSKLLYDGKDPLYQGKTALEYIQNHLGYRLVMRNVDLPRKSQSGDKINLNISIENVGFGSVIKNKNASLIIVDNDNNIIKEIDITNSFDIKSFKSKQIIDRSVSFDLPNNLPAGSYKLFLRVSNEYVSYGKEVCKDEVGEDGEKDCEIVTTEFYYNAIRFANAQIWNEVLQANRIGTINIK